VHAGEVMPDKVSNLGAGEVVATKSERKVHGSGVARLRVLAPPSHTARKVSREVVFAPVTCVYAYREFAQAIACANDLPLASQASVFTNNLQMALRAAERLEASTVLVNDHTAFRLGHVRRAQVVRYGIGGIGWTRRELTKAKLIVLRRT
jgi:acyl-CoA reductase-like NAD-dependent aldehyde dehydrogenase